MRYTYMTNGVCAGSIEFDINGDKITNVKFNGGCNGNLKAISILVEGMTVDEIEKKLNRGKIAEGFVTATLMYCVGSMAIMGSLESALGDPTQIYVKTVLDFISSIVLGIIIIFLLCLVFLKQ